ncbi:MAG TPA: SIS domain-containing protein [Streptosporangiaceae bacterium]|nr:SIS domain-containing protein [Streptosporangiaceae bacterium]
MTSGTAASNGTRKAENDAIAAFARRETAARDLVDRAADIADTAFAMASRFRLGGKLLVFGVGTASTDAQHVAVEFVHPVIVGKRALPAVSLTADAATVTAIAASAGMGKIFEHQVRQLAAPADIALGIGRSPSVVGGLGAARELGLLTVALAGAAGAADGTVIPGEPAAAHVLAVRSADPRIVKEIHVTTYHLLWELVHVFLEQPLAEGRGAR